MTNTKSKKSISVAPPDKDYGLSNSKPCYFCGEEYLLYFHEHYAMCPDCTAVYTITYIVEKNCEHIGNETPVLIREPWYKNWDVKLKNEKKAYIIEENEYKQFCSLCNKPVIADGW